MKRRNYIVVMMMGLLLGSCSSEDILSVPNGNGRIRFDVGVSQSEEVTVTPMNGSTTRSAEPLFLPTSSIEMHSGDMKMYANCASTADIPMHNIVPETTTRGSIKTEADFYPEFGLFGYFYDNSISWNESSFTPQLSIDNAKATNNNGNWTTNVYWPGASKKATFFAYAPYNANVTLESETGTPKMTFTVPDDIASQQDLLVAKKTDISCDGNTEVALNFKHVLSAIKFVKGATPGFSAIKQIQISGVNNQGTLNMDSQSWESADGSATYTISTIDENTVCFLMPQIVPSGAKLSVTFSNGATEQTYEADIENTTWEVGYQYTYSLSINKISGEFIFEVNGPSESVSADGGIANFTVKSYYHYNDNLKDIPIPWSGKYKIGDNEYILSGDGSVNDDIRKISVPANNSALSHKALLQFINYSDSNEPHDLSMFNGKQSTANCYVVQGCGWFKLPLVYGNGITNGEVAGKSTNASSNNFAYNNSSSFVNHAGTAIYSLSNAPYIYDNGYSVDGAEVVWESISGLITSPSILDGKYLQFYVDPDKVDQANAVIAVKSGSTIIWSWHLWFTASSWTATYTYGSNKFMTMPLGFIDSSSSGTATPKILPFTLAQNITKGKTETVMVSQNGVSSSGGTCTFYQWGRKDPFPGATANDQETDNIPSETYYYSSILNPGKFIIGSGSSPYNYNWFNGEFHDLWNVGNSSIENTTSISKKTIYDPSPVGFKVPPPAAFSSFSLGSWNSTLGQEGRSVLSTGDFWRVFGYLAAFSGSSLFVGARGFYWSCGPMPNSSSSRYGCAMDFTSGSVYSQTTHYLAHGLSVRPVTEQ